MNKKKRNAFLANARQAQKRQVKRQLDKTPYLTAEEFVDDDKDDGIYENAIFNGCGPRHAFFVLESGNGQRKISGYKSLAKGFDENDDDARYNVLVKMLPITVEYPSERLYLEFVQLSD